MHPFLFFNEWALLQLAIIWYKSWRENYVLGHKKQTKVKLSCFVLDVPVRNLLSSIAVLVLTG